MNCLLVLLKVGGFEKRVGMLEALANPMQCAASTVNENLKIAHQSKSFKCLTALRRHTALLCNADDSTNCKNETTAFNAPRTRKSNATMNSSPTTSCMMMRQDQ